MAVGPEVAEAIKIEPAPVLAAWVADMPVRVNTVVDAWFINRQPRVEEPLRFAAHICAILLAVEGGVPGPIPKTLAALVPNDLPQVPIPAFPFVSRTSDVKVFGTNTIS